MKTIYLDCGMGAAGDMLMASLLELSFNPENFLHTMNHLGVPGDCVSAEKVYRYGVTGTHIRVLWNELEEQSYDVKRGEQSSVHIDGEKPTNPMDIKRLLTSLPLPNKVIENAIAVLGLIFEAESCVHGTSMSDIHESRLGTMDAIVDVLGCCILIYELNPEKILASPIRAGFGQIHCARGILPVPASATKYLLRGNPYYSGDIQGEFCTPTGAALLRHFVDEFAPVRDSMKVIKTGCGIGTKDFGIPGGLQAHYSDNLDV